MFKQTKNLAFAICLSTFIVPSMASQPTPTSKTPADTAVVAKVTIEGKVVEITIADLKKRLKSLPKEIQTENLDKIFEPLLQTTIDMLILTNNAKKQGLDKDEEVKQRIKDCEEATLQKAYLDKEVEVLQTDVVLKKSYDELIKILPNVDEVSFSQAAFRGDKAKAEKFLKELKANGGDFKKTLEEAQKKDPEIKGMADIGYTKIPELPPALAEAIKNAKNATVVPKVIEEKLGQESVYFVVYVKDRRAAQKPTFEQAKGELKAITMPKFAQEVIERDRKEFKIEKFDMEGKPLPDKAPAAAPAPEAPKAPEAKAPAA